MLCSLYRPGAAVRAAALALVASVIAGCSGGTHMLPLAPEAASGGPAAVGAAAPGTARRRPKVAVRMRIRIPRRRGWVRTVHPSTISGLTQSVSIAVDGGAAQVFDTTPASPGCSTTSGGTTCEFSVAARAGTDTFVVTTWNETGGSGTALDQGTAEVPIALGKANAVAVSLGPVVSTTADAGVGSLRYAVGSASPGDTIVFLLAAGSTIALASPIAVSGNVTIAGPGVSHGITVSGGGAHQVFVVTGTATISGLIVANGKAATAGNPGGAISNLGSLTLTNDSIGSSTSTVAIRRGRRVARAFFERIRPHCSTTYAEGGALYNDGELTMSGNTFNANTISNDASNCIAGQGGAIFNDVDGTLSSTGDTFTNNAAEEGGAVFNQGSGAVTFSGDSFTANLGCTALTGCPTNCTPTSCTSNAEGSGAAIADGGTSGVRISSSTFTGNVAGGATPGSSGGGGALALESLSPVVTNSTFTDNVAGGATASCGQGNGGAIIAAENIELDNDTFTGNKAIGDSTAVGGAVADLSGTVSGTGNTFKSNQASETASACAPSKDAVGGAVVSSAGMVTLSNSDFEQNSATGNAEGVGGAIAANIADLSGDTFTSNGAAAIGAMGASTEAVGGALATETSTVVTGCKFTSNVVAIQGAGGSESVGGAIASPDSFTSSATIYNANSATAGASGIAAGGAVGLISGTATAFSSGDTFENNKTNAAMQAGGGAIYIGGSFAIDKGTFSNNSATATTSATGGAVAGSANGSMHGDTFTGNVAASSTALGGALYLDGTITIANAAFSQNKATSAGGAVVAGDVTIDQSTVTNNAVTAANIAQGGGGGIFAAGPILLSGSTVAGNRVVLTSSATGGGGGGIYDAAGLTVTQSTVSGNAVTGSATGAGGGGIFAFNDLTLTNATVTGNASSVDGGGVEIAANASVAFTNATLYENTATGSGGNVDNLFALTLTNSIVAGGKAASGPDIDNTGSLTSGDYNLIQTPVAGNALMGTTTDDLAKDPMLLPLADNGGPTFTNADQLNSPGRGHITYMGGNCGTVALGVDQRGYVRGSNGSCDIGAFEYYGTASAVARSPHLPHLRGGFSARFRRLELHGLRMPSLQ